MPKKYGKIDPHWIRQTRKMFRGFLNETHFPNPLRQGERGPEFTFPEWLIMFIAILSVKCEIKTYRGIHRMTSHYWEVISEGLQLDLISETQLKDRLKKIGHEPGKPANFIFQLFPELDPTKSSERR